MKRLVFIFIFAAITLLPALAEAAELRGVWVASIGNMDYPSAPGLSPKRLMAEADELVDKCAELGMNAIFFQVRPKADALYRSKIFPSSVYLTGESSYEPLNFDPLAYLVEKAHSRGLELHAWINPYRVASAGEGLEAFSPRSPQRLHPEYLLRCGDGSYIFNPALPQVRELITAGVTEIADGYEVDGIHFDDYFYPDVPFDDSEFFAASGAEDLGDWRRENVNALVRQVSAALRERGMTFGISPRGVWANRDELPLGSDTHGGGSYSAVYCDSLTFIREELVDYICPQLYWPIGYEPADYSVLVRWWAEAVKGVRVKLYIGMGDYRILEEGPLRQDAGEMSRQLELNKKYPAVTGEVHFHYSVIRDSEALSALYACARVPEEGAMPPPGGTAERLKFLLRLIFKKITTG